MVSFWPFLRGGGLNDIRNLIGELWIHPDTGLWFLWVLALNEIWFYISCKISEQIECKNVILKKTVGFVIVLILVHLIWKFYKPGGMELLYIYLKFFLMGNICCMVIKEYGLKLKLVYKLIIIILFSLLVLGWGRLEMPIENILTMLDLSLVREIIFELYKVLIPILGIAVMFFVSEIILKIKIISSLIEIIGKYTIGIYSLHLFFFGIYSSNLIMNGIFVCTILVLFPIIFQLIIKNIPYLGFFVFGIDIKKEGKKNDYCSCWEE